MASNDDYLVIQGYLWQQDYRYTDNMFCVPIETPPQIQTHFTLGQYVSQSNNQVVQTEYRQRGL